MILLRSNFVGNCSVQTMAGEWIPLQSSLVATKQFFAIGGFNVLIPSSEDIDLLRRLTLVTDVAPTEVVVACVGMGVDNSTTDHVNRDKLARIGREQALNTKGAFRVCVRRPRRLRGKGAWSDLHNFGGVECQAGKLECLFGPQRNCPGGHDHGRIRAVAC